HSWRPEARSCGALAGAAPPRSWGSVPSSPTHHGSCGAGTGPRASRGGWPAASPRDGAWPGDSQGSVAASRGSLGLGLGLGLGQGAGRRAGPGAPTSPAATGRLKPRNRVTFEEGGGARRVQPGQSLPDLRSEWDPDSGDSTDSLIDEAEEYLRRSIDSILTGADVGRVGRRRQLRRYSEPDPIRELTPPQSAQPFLPKVPRDLKLDYFVKVITAEGRVMVGRVRYVGAVPGRSDPHVGVELPKAAGDSDGSYQGRRFFDCDPDYALFVPFKKVVMAWSV
ncbi:Restin homolog, partial [Gryllus bimaculatus]